MLNFYNIKTAISFLRCTASVTSIAIAALDDSNYNSHCPRQPTHVLITAKNSITLKHIYFERNNAFTNNCFPFSQKERNNTSVEKYIIFPFSAGCTPNTRPPANFF
jgi:hypothetical protein